MRFTTLACAVLGATVARAADAADAAAADEGASTTAEAVEAPEAPVIEKPTFTPISGIKAPFIEQFTSDWETRWKASHAKKENEKEGEEWAYVGTWSVEEPHVFKGMHGDKGLVVKDAAAHHAISAKFAKPISNKKDTLVVQYEVKLQGGLECGGAYLKLLQDNKKLARDEFSNASPYIIMFGPDKCGSTNKVHFIFRHKNPKSGEYEEKHLNSPPLAQITKLTSLYTLVVKPDQTFEIMIDGESKRNGSLLEDFSPAVNPPKEIDDPEDKKPETWVDEAQIPDPKAVKPEDWDEDAPYEIIDEEATQPEDWLVSEPSMIPDPEATRPEDWDDEEDGDWAAPQISNPKCEEISGCGPWEKPMKRNDAYKGKWSAPMIENPAYKGVWAPRKIPNPKYFQDKTPANFEPMGAIGFEIWTMQKDILFDNIYIGHSVADAAKLAAATFDLKHPIEKAEEEATMPKPEDPVTSQSGVKFMDSPITFVKEKVDLFITLAKNDPIMAVKSVPEVVGGVVGLVLLLVAIAAGVVVAGAKAPGKEEIKAKAALAKDKVADAKDTVTEAVASGADKAGDAVKRATRSTAS